MILREKVDTAARAIGFYPRRAEEIPMADHLASILRIYPTTAGGRLSALCLTQILK